MNMKTTLLIITSLFLTVLVHAQGVKISTIPSPPDSSAALEIDFNNKGFLVPRMSEANRLAIPNPATSVLVYQTDGTKPGFYFNYGTPNAPEWRRLLMDPIDAAACDSSNLEFTITPNIDTVEIAPGNATGVGYENLVLDFDYLSGDRADVGITVSGMPNGVIYDMDVLGSSFPSTATFTFHASFADAVPGNYPITITAHCGASPQSVTIILSVLPFKRVFVTSAAVPGNFGGATGADFLCQSAANSQSLGGTWRAWVSTATGGDPAMRFNGSQATDPYVLVDGTLIALDFARLNDYYAGLANPLLNPINMDEQGNIVPDDEPVWSNTNPDGTAHSNCCVTINDSRDCFDYTSAVGNGHHGATGYVEQGRWSDEFNGYQPCNQPARLYCFEQ